MHHVPLNRPGPDNGDFDDDVVELLGPQSGEHRHLRARLDLENPHRVRFANHFVDGGVLIGKSMNFEPLL